MSAALTYREPYRFSAAVLALAMHLFFFFLLYSSFRWQSHAPETFVVEMWDSLPETEVIPELEPTPPPPTAAEPAPPLKVVEPVLPPAKADIEVRDKKKKLAKEKAAAKAKQERERRELEAYSERRRQDEQARVRAEVDAAIATQVGRYQDLIRNKIRRNIVMPPDVPETAKAEFKVTLLPDGSVMQAELLKSSGNAAYDNAAERAIYKAQPLPMPPDEGLQKMFRELRLTIRP
jgi:colicin import membrane protein